MVTQEFAKFPRQIFQICVESSSCGGDFSGWNEMAFEIFSFFSHNYYVILTT